MGAYLIIERANYYTILAEGIRTIREGALTEVARYFPANHLNLEYKKSVRSCNSENFPAEKRKGGKKRQV